MRKSRINNRGFTLIEMLVVMAVSVILMGLVLGPVIQSFALTRRAQAMVDAQDAARLAMEEISRDLGQAMYVYDNAYSPIDLPVPNAGGATEFIKMKFAKIDFVLPKMVMHCNNPDHPSDKSRDYARDVLISDPDTGEHRYSYAWPKCPVCGSVEVEARPKLPLEQDATIVRYFLGLARNKMGGTPPNHGYVSPWDGAVETGAENQVVLYRVEFSPYDDTLFPADMRVTERMSDPMFFYRPEFADRWASIARVVGSGKYEDLVVATYTSNVVTSVEPTITFRTSAMDNDTFKSAYSSDKSFEYPDAAPTVYNGAYGYWTPDNRVTLYRDDFNTAYSTKLEDDNHLWIVKYVKNGSGWDETKSFDITKYLADGYVSTKYDGKVPEMGFTIDANRGAVCFALNPPRQENGPANGPVSILDPAEINASFRDEYDATSTGRRWWKLATFDRNATDQYIPNVVIVPGSERVFGPDGTPGANPMRIVRYQRVPLQLGDAGLNQYKIDYDNGEIFFSSVYNEDLPEARDPGSGSIIPINVDYKVQFNRKDDIVRGDYATKSTVTIHLGMRMFDPDSGKPYPVDLTKNIKIRNALR